MTSLLAERAYRIKKATGDDATFEDSLASIGRSALSGKAPALANHEIGFQVLDKNDDNTRAVGVFGYRVGNKLLYIPLFYRDGVVKGVEQLRDPKRKIAVPCSDPWINKFMGEKGDTKPDRISRATQRTTGQPSLWQLKYPPTKWAHETTWADGARADLALAIGRRPRPWAAHTDDLVKLAGEHPRLMDAFAEWYTKYAWFAHAVRKFYPAGAVEAAVKSAAAIKTAAARKTPVSIFTTPAQPVPRLSLFPQQKRAAERARPAVSVIRVKMVSLESRPIHPDMDFDKFTRHEIESGRNVYKDFRADDEVSDADVWLGGATARGTSLHNPSSNGIYEVIGADNAVHKCAVLTPLLGWGTTQDRCLIVRLRDGAHTETNRNAVWVRGEADKPAFRDWVHSLPKVKENGKFPVDRVAAISLDETDVGMATAPMYINEGGDVVAGCGSAADADRPYWAPFSPWRDRPDLHAGSRPESAPKRVSVLETTGRPLIRANHLYLPLGSRWIKLDGDRFRQAEGSEPDRFLLWTRKAADENRKIVQIDKTASAFVLGARAYRDRNDLEEVLVLHHGLKVAAARAFVDEAVKNKTAVAAVKYAAGPGMGLSHDYPNAPAADDERMRGHEGFADDILPSVTSSTIAQPIPDLLEQPGAQDRARAFPTEHGLQVSAPGVGNSGDTYGGRDESDPGADDVAAVADAARTGRKELFDTAALAALVKHTKLRSLRDKVCPRMLKQITDMGDLLAHMAWNTEEWSEQFGRSEIGPLEDQIRDLFDGAGDLYLKLQEKSVAGDPDMGVLPDEAPGDAADSDQ